MNSLPSLFSRSLRWFSALALVAIVLSPALLSNTGNTGRGDDPRITGSIGKYEPLGRNGRWRR